MNDDVIRLDCLRLAVGVSEKMSGTPEDVIRIAKQLYDWVTAGTARGTSNG